MIWNFLKIIINMFAWRRLGHRRLYGLNMTSEVWDMFGKSRSWKISTNKYNAKNQL